MITYSPRNPPGDWSRLGVEPERSVIMMFCVDAVIDLTAKNSNLSEDIDEIWSLLYHESYCSVAPYWAFSDQV